MSDIVALRAHLFDVLAGLKDKYNPMDIERAKAVSDVAQTIINSAKVEVDFMKATGSTSSSGFISASVIPDKKPVITGNGVKLVQSVPGGTVTTHKMR